jgi:histidyl-tRNA synthetase
MRRELEAAGLGHLEGMLMKIVSLRGDQEILEKAREIVGNAGAAKALDYLGKLGEILNAYGIQGITYDLGVVRGLDYYNGMVFEVHHRPLGAASQVCGGGAYSLTEVFGGEPISTTGFGMGIDRVLLAMELESVQTPSSRFLAYVIPVGQSARLKAVAISMQLRRSGLAVDLDLVGRGPSKNLEYANSLKARYAILVGEAELARNAVAVRDLTSGDQQEVPIESLVSHLTHRVC